MSKPPKAACCGGTSDLTVWDGASEGSLARALMPPAIACVGPDVRWRRGWRMSVASPRCLSLTVTTGSAYHHRIAKVFVDALSGRLSLPGDLRERVRTALHEAMMNALVHGNMGLGLGERNDLRELAAAGHIVAGCLAADALNPTLLRLNAHWTKAKLRVVVRDSGVGFSENALPTADQRQAAGIVGSGRGMDIIRAFCDRVSFTRGGAAIALEFDLLGGPTH